MVRQDDLPRHYIGTKRAYEVHKNNNDLDPNGFYFLIDTNEVIFEDKNYNHQMLYYTGELPSVKTPNRIYFNLSTLEAHLWNGSEWILIFSPVDTTLITTTGSSRVVSGEVVKDYADRILKDTLRELISLKTFNFDPETRCLNIHIGNNNKLLELTYFASTLSVSEDQYTLQLKDSTGTIISSVILYPCHVAQGKFNIETLSLDFYYSDDRPVVSIPIPEVFNLLLSQNTNTISTSISPNDRSFIKMDVNISQQEDNQLKLKEDGLYIDWNKYIDKISPDKEGSIMTLDEKGNIKPVSGITTTITQNTDKAVSEDGVYSALTSIYSDLAKNTDVWDDELGISSLCNSLRVRKINT